MSIPEWNDGTKPSPAPWTVVRSEIPYASWIMAADSSCVCLGFGFRDERLLISAPLLKRACEAALGLIRDLDLPYRTDAEDLCEAALLAAQPAPEPSADECAHCWHGTGTALLSMPPKYPQVCCHCGETRLYTPPAPLAHGQSIPPPHGPHAPSTHYHQVFIAAPPPMECSCGDGCDGVRGSASCVAGK